MPEPSRLGLLGLLIAFAFFLLGSSSAQAQAPADSAQFISQSAPPAEIQSGLPYTVSVTMKNTGTTTWTTGPQPASGQPSGYMLVSMNPTGGDIWNTVPGIQNPNNSVPISATGSSSVAPGQTATFTFTAYAPSGGPGAYNFQWQMMHNFVRFFGDVTPNVVCSVLTDNAAFVSQVPPPATMTAGQSYPVSVTMQNTGTSTWQDGTCQILSENPRGNQLLGVSSQPVVGTVAPGGNTTVSFSAVAPSTPGSYNFQWSLSRKNIHEFGQFSANVPVTVVAAPPPSVSDLSTYSTGSGRIALYWTPVANAIGYNINRGTASGGEDYSNPVNGSTLVNAASYSGSPMDMFSDTGLTNGTEYFYTVTAVYSSGQSQPSNEDSDIPDPVDVPWDTRNSGAILSAIRSDFSDDTNSIGSDPFSLRAVGPDGTIYDDNFSAAQPPDGVINAATAQLVRPDGSTQTLPNDNGELYIAPSSGSTTAQSPAASTPAKLPNGPIRRVVTFPNYRGADGYFALPTTSTNSQAAIANGDAATIYLGVVGQNLAVDAGLVYSDTTHWGLEMLITGHVHGIVGQPDPNSNKAIIPEVKLVNAPNANIRFSSGSTVRMTYWAWSDMKKIAHQKLSLLVVDDVDNGFAGALAGPASALGKQENVAAKRVHSIAQNQLGVTPTGSRMDNCAWDQGQVILPGTSNISQVWNAPITTEDLKYMGGNSNVTATELSPYTAESNINIDIYAPTH